MSWREERYQGHLRLAEKLASSLTLIKTNQIKERNQGTYLIGETLFSEATLGLIACLSLLGCLISEAFVDTVLYDAWLAPGLDLLDDCLSL